MPNIFRSNVRKVRFSEPLFENTITVGINVNFGSISQQQLHDFKRSGFRAIVQSRVSFDGFSVDVSFSIDEKPGDFQVTFVASNHQASVTMSIGNFNICKIILLIIDRFLSDLGHQGIEFSESFDPFVLSRSNYILTRSKMTQWHKNGPKWLN